MKIPDFVMKIHDFVLRLPRAARLAAAAALVIVILAVASSAARAEVRFDPATASLVVTGQTTQFQVSDAIEAMRDNDVGTVYLAGPGGDFYAGLRLGRAIRDEGARVIVPVGLQCVSACAFAALGAEDVNIDGEMWFHGPFYPAVPSGETVERIARKFGEGYMDMAAYMIEMGLTLDAARQLLRLASPCKFIILKSKDEMVQLREAGRWVAPVFMDVCGKA